MTFKYLLALAALTFHGSTSLAQQSTTAAQWPCRTLRIDYIFSGDAHTQEVSIDELCSIDGWAGRRVNMDSLALRGNGNITMRDARSHRTLYRHSFSTLFQEWQGTEEAQSRRRAFENVFLLPMPTDSVDINVVLYNLHGDTCLSYTHGVNPNDILIRPLRAPQNRETKTLLKSTSPSAIDIAILGEGYTAAERDSFFVYARRASDEIFSYAPFNSFREAFNVVAVALPSSDSGVSIPGSHDWKRTALSSHFDTFYSDRYLTTLRLRNLHDALVGIPYEHIIILANTDNYGGGGIYNSYMLTTARHSAFRPVVVHEFGHSFAGLADEYYYDDQYTEFYYPDREPWEQNITTLKDFSCKWQDMITRENGAPGATTGVGLYEGGGYQSKGVWRPCDDCRMKTNTATAFCPVCQRAIARLIEFYTVDGK